MAEVIEEMRRSGSTYPVSTIRTHIGSVMCVGAPINHAVTIPDLERVDRGRYRLAERRTAQLEGVMGPGTEDDEPAFDEETTLAPRPSQTSSPLDLEQVATVMAALAGVPLTTRVAAAEAALDGLGLDGLSAVLGDGVLSLETAVAAMAVRDSLGRINDLIHASDLRDASPDHAARRKDHGAPLPGVWE